MPVMKRAIKDSVFTFLFKQPEYTRQLYLVLHPEDTSVTEEECKIVTLEHVLTVGLYNDLGIQVRDKLIILVEAQSTFSENIPLRMLLYLSNTYFEHVKEQKLDLYGSRPVKIPRPELYVIYTGRRKDVPNQLCLSELYDGLGSVEVNDGFHAEGVHTGQRCCCGENRTAIPSAAADRGGKSESVLEAVVYQTGKRVRQ